jgi:NADH-quinone oxidoreductase subunit N
MLQTVYCFLIIISAISARFIPVDNPSFFTYEISSQLNILGRSLIITSGLKTSIILFYICLGLWSLGSFIFKEKSNIVPLGLTFVALLIAALAVEPFLYSALILEIAVLISVPMIKKESNFKDKGISRYLINFTFGMPFVLLAGWYLAGGEITPVNDEQLIQATFLLGLGFVFWLAVFPFQPWLPLLANETKPNEGLFILTLLPIAVVVLLLKYLNGFAWLRRYETVFEALRIFGLIMVVMGAIWFSMQKRIRKAMGYLILVSSGFMIIAIGLNSTNGYILSTYFMLLRIICFFMISWIVILLEKEPKIMTVDSLRGFFSTDPLLATGFFIALFSLLGMPLTAGFPIIQSLLAEISFFEPQIIIFIIFSQVILTITTIRWLFITFLPYDSQRIAHKPSVKIFIIAGIIGLIILGIFPSQFFPHVSEIVNDLPFLIK